MVYMTNINTFTPEKTNKPLHESRQDHATRGEYDGHQDARMERKFSNERLARMEQAFATIAMTEEIEALEDAQELQAEDFDLAA